MTRHQPLPTALDTATRLLGTDEVSAFWAAHNVEIIVGLALWVIVPGLIMILRGIILRAIRDWPPRLNAAEAEEFGEMWGRGVEEKRHVIVDAEPRIAPQ